MSVTDVVVFIVVGLIAGFLASRLVFGKGRGWLFDIIIGMRKLEHVRQNIAMSDPGPLEADLLRTLKAHRWDRRPQPWSD